MAGTFSRFKGESQFITYTYYFREAKITNGFTVQEAVGSDGCPPPTAHAYTGRTTSIVALPARFPVFSTTNTFSATEVPGCVSPKSTVNSFASFG